MKKFITGIAFALVVVFGMNTAAAQSLTKDDTRPEAIAKQAIADMSSDLDLTGDQQRSLFRAYVQKEVNYKKNITGKDLKSATVIAEKKKYDAQLAASVKKLLSPAQFKKWLSLQR